MSNILEIKDRIDIEDLKAKKLKLTAEKSDIQRSLSDLNITSNADRLHRMGKIKINPEKIELRNVYKARLHDIEVEIQKLNKIITPINMRVEHGIEQNRSRLIKSILTDEQLKEFYHAVNKMSMDGPVPKLSFSVKSADDLDNYKKLCSVFLEALIKARKSMTSVNEAGCKKFDKGYFMQVVSPLNRELPPLNELEKIKRLNNL